jgi:hypothetical protein
MLTIRHTTPPQELNAFAERFNATKENKVTVQKPIIIQAKMLAIGGQNIAKDATTKRLFKEKIRSQMLVNKARQQVIQSDLWEFEQKRIKAKQTAVSQVMTLRQNKQP